MTTTPGGRLCGGCAVSSRHGRATSFDVSLMFATSLHAPPSLKTRRGYGYGPGTGPFQPTRSKTRTRVGGSGLTTGRVRVDKFQPAGYPWSSLPAPAPVPVAAPPIAPAHDHDLQLNVPLAAPPVHRDPAPVPLAPVPPAPAPRCLNPPRTAHLKSREKTKNACAHTVTSSLSFPCTLHVTQS